MLYILLIIIAIGVLLISDEGKSLLGIISMIAFLVGLIFLAYWVIVFVVSSNRDTEIALGALFFFFYFIFVLNKLYRDFKTGKYTWRNLVQKGLSRSKDFWKKHKIAIIVVIVAILFFPTLFLLLALL